MQINLIEKALLEAQKLEEELKKNKLQKSSGVNPKDLLGIQKPSLSLVPSIGILKIAEAMKNGAGKYGAYNWRQNKVQMVIYLDAILRHTIALLDGEDIAIDSKLPHLSHIGANVCILLDAEAGGNLIDNRYKQGCANTYLNSFVKEVK